MARSLSLVTILYLVVFFVVLVPAPLVSSAGRLPNGSIGRYSFRLRPDQVTKARNFLRKHAGDILDVFQEILQPEPAKKGADDKPAESAANTAGLYIFNLSVGTPAAQDVVGVLDVTLSFVWAQCESCTPCLPAPALRFQWKASPSFNAVPCASPTCQQSVLKQTCPVDGGDYCTYIFNYGGGTNTTGFLANDTFTFGGPTPTSRVVPVPGVLFGCSLASTGDFSGASGSFGFGRGPLSLVSQLQLSWFSYLLAPDGSGSGAGNLLEFGDDDAVPRSSRGQSTPLVRNSVYPDLYFVKLKAIQVNGRDLTGIPAGVFDLQANGSGGVVLSTTTPATYLEEAAYKVVRQAFVGGIASEPVDGSALGLDLCYAMPSIDNQLKVPKLTLVFDGGATSTGTTATMELKKNNYFFRDTNTGLECLTIMPSRGGSVLGSLMQTDTNMTYDIHGEQLIFETAFAPPPYSKASVLVLAPLVALAWMLLAF